MKKIRFVFVVLAFIASAFTYSQVVDQVVAVIGNKMVKLSEVERLIQEMRVSSGVRITHCEALENMMVSTLYTLQAEEDSIFVTDAQVEEELDKRIRYFVDQFGSREKLEQFYGKTVIQIKEEYREPIKQSIVSSLMEGNITKEVKVTPSEIKRYYNSLPKDSVPLIPLEYELSVIVKKTIVGVEEKNEAKGHLEELRARIVKGERFSGLAGVYSEDPGSRRKGGELGYTQRGDWTPEFEAMANSLEIGELSPVFETPFGFHLLEVLDKKGELTNARHILIRPKASTENLMSAERELSTVRDEILAGKYTFDGAVKIFSDEAGRQGDGVYLSPLTRKPRYNADEIEPQVLMAVEKLREGEVSMVQAFEDEEGKMAFRIFYVHHRVAPHKATLESDYDKIYDMALARARRNKMDSWMKEKIADTYIRLMGPFANCKFKYRWGR
ncbi:MAG: peptidylprolyl isomerase [Bacteroidales bacterium]|jgi:peptidyl-prolyl cis-trans isomerase SurA|nr:peptidylprolyl isomerase [Bacteroidales bacterium]